MQYSSLKSFSCIQFFAPKLAVDVKQVTEEYPFFLASIYILPFVFPHPYLCGSDENELHVIKLLINTTVIAGLAY